MKKYLYISISMLVSCQALADDLKTNSWGAVTNNFQMAISLKDDKKQIGTNQPVILLVRFRNCSTNEAFHVFEANGTIHDPSYSFMVISPAGKDVSPNLKKYIPESGADRVIHPNETIRIEFNLSLLCNFDEVGTYKIIAKHTDMWSFEKHEAFTVVSNPLYVSVVPEGVAH